MKISKHLANIIRNRVIKLEIFWIFILRKCFFFLKNVEIFVFENFCNSFKKIVNSKKKFFEKW